MHVYIHISAADYRLGGCNQRVWTQSFTKSMSDNKSAARTQRETCKEMPGWTDNKKTERTVDTEIKVNG